MSGKTGEFHFEEQITQLVAAAASLEQLADLADHLRHHRDR